MSTSGVSASGAQRWIVGAPETSTVDRAAPGGVSTEDLAQYCLMLGDDALVLGQRLCQWIPRAPMIEEDLALSNIALDLIGHARVLLSRSGELDGSGRDEDDLAFGRTEREFRNALLVELPGEDFAVTIARQLVFAHYAVPFYERLAGCADAELAASAARRISSSVAPGAPYAIFAAIVSLKITTS